MFIELILYLYLSIISFFDIKYGLIPNSIVYSLFLIVFCLYVSRDFQLILPRFLAAVFIAGIIFIIQKITKGLGGGDIKLIFLCTFCSGFFRSLIAIILGCLIGIGFFIVRRVINRPVFKLPFAPLITLGYLFTTFEKV